MAKKKLSKNAKITIAAMAIFVVIVIALIVTYFYYTIVATSPIVRKKMLKHYRDDSSYREVYAKITQAPDKYDDGNMFIGVEFISEGNDGFVDRRGFYMPQTNYDIMVENGVDFEDSETVYKFVASPMIWWNGWQPFAVAMYSEDGQTIYLDYETGKSNLLYYIEKVMK